MWYANFYYMDWTGTRKHICKRGFATQREAKDFEKVFLDKQGDRSDILFGSLVDNYMENMRHRLRQTTMATKQHLIDTKILPYFKKLKTCDISSEKVMKWQNVLLEMKDENGNPYKPTYIRTIHNQLSAILNYAVKHYGLSNNPCAVAGSVGAPQAEEMLFWTREQFNQFISVMNEPRMHLAFNIFFYSGIRSGELLALSPSDILDTCELRICKTYVKLHGVEYLNPAKTKRGNRTISIPKAIYNETKDLISMLYGIQPNDRIFDFTKTCLEKVLERGAKKAGLPRIRVHDLRHSNAAMLIDLGVDIMEISRRLGHESVKTTWDTYGHLYPDKDKRVATKLDDIIADLANDQEHHESKKNEDKQ